MHMAADAGWTRNTEINSLIRRTACPFANRRSPAIALAGGGCIKDTTIRGRHTPTGTVDFERCADGLA